MASQEVFTLNMDLLSNQRYTSLIRGSVQLNSWPGLTLGTGLDSATRQANAVAMQAAIQYAVDNKKYLEVQHPGSGLEYEFESATGLVIPEGSTGFQWWGDEGAIIKQFANNAPILTVGGASESQRIQIHGAVLRYNEDQAGNTNSIALKLGALWQAHIEKVTTGAAHLSARPYIGCYIIPSEFFFSNTVEHCRFFRSAQTNFRQGCLGTGNVFRDLYCSGRTTGGVAGSTPAPVMIDADGAGMQENVYEQLNIEWHISQYLLQLENCRAISFISTHFEGNRLSATAGAFVYSIISSPNFHGVVFLNNRIASADGAGANCSYFKGWQSCGINVNGFHTEVDTSSHINQEHYLFYQADTDAYIGQPSTFMLRNYRGSDHAASYTNLSIDRRLPRATFGPGRFTSLGEVFSHDPLTTVRSAWLRPSPAADMTVYGVYENPNIHYPVSMGGAHRTVTLSNRMGPSGTAGSNVPIPAGRMCVVRRSAGTPDAFNLIVANHNGSTLSTISTADTRVVYFFNGTDWVVQT